MLRHSSNKADAFQQLTRLAKRAATRCSLLRPLPPTAMKWTNIYIASTLPSVVLNACGCLTRLRHALRCLIVLVPSSFVLFKELLHAAVIFLAIRGHDARCWHWRRCRKGIALLTTELLQVLPNVDLSDPLCMRRGEKGEPLFPVRWFCVRSTHWDSPPLR